MKSRPYEMRARADSAAVTAERILDAVERLFFAEPGREPTVAAIAAEAEVSAQTVIRRFGGRDGAEAAAFARAAGRIEAHRAESPPGDLRAAVANLVEHYESVGDGVLRMLADEHRRPLVGEVVAAGRRVHERWCSRVFAATLAPLRGGARARRLAQLMAVCDVYVWKVLRRDRGLSTAHVELALREMLAPLI
ncbi:TetR/AcrR family transcriptional regulator [uncultured Jatrophihabitans sp.]|uniref:TetR/AcrR family transcriptional regulator n=1 Tax=uncultured Jatrophihabitans sp. TaxID=1610747 RepID=UPI0035CAEAB6